MVIEDPVKAKLTAGKYMTYAVSSINTCWTYWWEINLL